MNNLLNHEDIPDGSSAITSSTYVLVGNRLSKTAPPGVRLPAAPIHTPPKRAAGSAKTPSDSQEG